MRALTLSFSLLISVQTYASTIAHPLHYFYLEARNKHGGREWSRVFSQKENDKTIWICQTESIPYYERKTDPAVNIDIKKIAKDPRACRNYIVVKDLRHKDGPIAAYCHDNPEATQIKQQIDKACRPSF